MSRNKILDEAFVDFDKTRMVADQGESTKDSMAMAMAYNRLAHMRGLQTIAMDSSMGTLYAFVRNLDEETFTDVFTDYLSQQEIMQGLGGSPAEVTFVSNEVDHLYSNGDQPLPSQLIDLPPPFLPEFPTPTIPDGPYESFPVPPEDLSDPQDSQGGGGIIGQFKPVTKEYQKHHDVAKLVSFYIFFVAIPIVTVAIMAIAALLAKEDSAAAGVLKSILDFFSTLFSI